MIHADRKSGCRLVTDRPALAQVALTRDDWETAADALDVQVEVLDDLDEPGGDVAGELRRVAALIRRQARVPGTIRL